jgi:chaperonin cofactor prefoldin
MKLQSYSITEISMARLRKEISHDNYFVKADEAEARIKELEKENSKLRKALKETKKQIQVLPWLGG